MIARTVMGPPRCRQRCVGGHLSAHQLWHELSTLAQCAPGAAEGTLGLRRQVAWRDFCWHLYYHHPELPTENLRAEFDDFDWSWPGDSARAAHLATAWQRGRTGFALVDAGMAQLWQTGWMHNRARMVTASLLVKNLGLHWRVGEQWFWDTLVDADRRAIPPIGSGWLAVAPTLRPISGCSIQSCKPRSSIPRAAMWRAMPRWPVNRWWI